jgi:hypothetical protein
LGGTRISRKTSIDTSNPREQERHAKELLEDEYAGFAEAVEAAGDRRNDAPDRDAKRFASSRRGECRLQT